MTLRPAFDAPRLGSYVFMGFGALIVAIGVVIVFDDPGGLFAILFGAVFIGVGYVMRRLFAVPDGKREIAVASHDAIVTGSDGRRGTRSRTTLIQVDANATEAEIVAARAAWIIDAWRRRPDWVEGLIESDDARYGTVAYWAAGVWSVLALGAWGAALIWGGIAWMVAIGLSVGAAAFVAGAVRLAVRRRKFGPSRLRVDLTPIALGGRLEGEVLTGVPRGMRLDDRFAVTLRCVHRWEETTGTGDDRRTRKRRETLWEARSLHPGSPLDDRVAVPVGFAVPEDQPPVTLGGGSEGILWELEVTAAVPGVDYAATFELPVLDRDTADALRRPDR